MSKKAKPDEVTALHENVVAQLKILIEIQKQRAEYELGRPLELKK